MGTVILILFALLALSSVNGCDSINSNGDFDWGFSDEATASDGTTTSDGTSSSSGLPTCDGVVVISVDSESVRVPGDTGIFSSASSACGMSEGRGSADAVVVLQDALTRCNREEVATDGEYGPATLEAMRWPTTSGTDCVAGPSSGTTGGGSSSLPPTD